MGPGTITIGIAVPTEQTLKHAKASREESPDVSLACSGALNAESTNPSILLETRCRIHTLDINGPFLGPALPVKVRLVQDDGGEASCILGIGDIIPVRQSPPMEVMVPCELAS
jgi:hypothetical protein